MPEESPVLDAIADLTAAAGEYNSLPLRELVLARLAALIAVDAPAVSYLANASAAQESGVTADDIQGVMIAVAPVVGTSRVMSAAAKIAQALGLAIIVAESEDEAVAGSWDEGDRPRG